MNKIHTLDLHFLDGNEAIGSFLIETSLGPVLVESGPMTTYSSLQKAVEQIGFQIHEIQHVFLTHIHFDHAGAAWKLASHGAKIYVHPIGLPHLHQPEKLWNSAAQIYGDDMDLLWGEMQSIPLEQLVGVDDGDSITIGDCTINVIYTPGHAVHHNIYQVGDAVFTGDVAGVKIGAGLVVPPCPPPDINIELWKNSLSKIRSLQPKKMYLTHFGEQYNVEDHLNQLEVIMDDWSNWMKVPFENGTPAETIIPQFMAYTEQQLRDHGVVDEFHLQQYEYANPSWMSVNGLLRYWKLKSQGRI